MRRHPTAPPPAQRCGNDGARRLANLVLHRPHGLPEFALDGNKFAISYYDDIRHRAVLQVQKRAVERSPAAAKAAEIGLETPGASLDS